MVVVACLLLLLSNSIAGQALPTSSRTAPLAARSLDVLGTAEPGNLLARRTRSIPFSHRPWSPHLQDTARPPVPPSYTPLGPPSMPHVLGGEQSGWPGLSTAEPSRVPENGPFVDPTVGESSGKQLHKTNRRPSGMLANTPVAKAQALREAQAKTRKKRGKRTALMRLGRLKYATASVEEIRALRNNRNKLSLSKLTPEEKLEFHKKRNERSRRSREKKKAILRGNSSPGPALRKQGREGLDWEQEQARGKEAHQYALADTRMDEARQHAVKISHGPPRTHGTSTVPMSTLASSTGSSSHAPLPDVAHQPFPPGSSSSSLDLRLSLSAPGSSKFQQEEATPHQTAPPAARTSEDEMLRLTLAPPGEHDRLRLILAPPRHD